MISIFALKFPRNYRFDFFHQDLKQQHHTSKGWLGWKNLYFDPCIKVWQSEKRY